MDDIFCKIARGEIPATVVYSDDEFVAFDDIAPQAPVHTLVIPKQHYGGLGDDVPAELMGRMCDVIKHVAELKGVAETGYRVIVNVGPDAGQSVPHLHAHVIGGRKMAEGMIRWADEA